MATACDIDIGDFSAGVARTCISLQIQEKWFQRSASLQVKAPDSSSTTDVLVLKTA
jgi:hypothetical protein